MATGGTIEVVVPRRPQNGAHSRQLSVDQALQYTPMTTSILPAHDRIPLPQLGRSLDSRLTSPAERHAAYRSELFTPRVKERLAVLLDPSRLAEIKFRRPPAQHDSKTQPELHDVPKMILKMSKMDYTYPSSSAVTRSAGKKPTLQMPVIKPVVAKVVVEVPKPPASFDREVYSAIPDSPKRRKLAASTSKRQKDDQLLVVFENQLIEIFEAQDRFAPDMSETVKSNSTIFVPPEDEDDSEELRLTIPIHEDLQATLSQLVSSGRLVDASTEYLQRLQRLCEPAIEAAQTLNLRVPSDPSDEDISIWLSNLRKGRSGAASACTLIYTVLGASQNQELVNLEALQWLPNLLVNLFENCLIPVIEARPDGQQSQLFEFASSYSETLKLLLDVSRKLLDLVARVCVEIKGASAIVNSTEFLASKLIFVQNAFTDKTSAIGSQAYERVRKQAMAAVARFYAAFPPERSAILDEVLSSLDKLPSNSRSARQYKLGGNKNIQLVSALFMQLVQTSAMQSGKKEKRKGRHLHRQASLDPDDSDSDGNSGSDMEVDSVSNEKDPLTRLTQTAKNLFNDAFYSAQHIVVWMVDKASKVTKTGDSPYRNILDLFVEDLTLVVSSTDWPASELLLTVLAHRMVQLVQNGKSASTKNMALESLGVMGSAISVTRASARNLLSSILREGESSSSAVAQALSDLVRERIHFFLQDHDLVSPDGPFPIVHSYLAQKGGEGLRAKSARAYFLVQYAMLVSRTAKEQRNGEQDSQPNTNFEPTIEALLLQLSEADQFDDSADEHSEIKGSEAQLAYLLSILNGRFCRRFPEIAKTLASSLHSDQAQVRSRSLRSVAAMLETDSSLLDLESTLVDAVFKCASDDSSLVRDSALSLIARFIMPRPALEEKAFRRLLKCAADSNVGVQKRAIGHLKDVYLRETRPNMKATIAIEFLRRTADPEISVAELAKKTLTEIWIEPKLAGLTSAGDTAHVDVAIEDLKTHIVTCISSDTTTLSSLLKTFLTWKLKDTKNASQVRELCARIVKKLLDTANGSEAAAADLTTLVAFAEARPETVVPADLASLKSYLKDLSKHDNILKFKSVVAIFRSVLPHLSSTQGPLLEDVQIDLLRAAQKLVPRQELEEVMSCLRSIDGVLQNNGKTAKFAISLVKNVLQPNIPSQIREELKRQNKFEDLKARENRVREQSLRLIGVVGKHIDLERFRTKFQETFSSSEPPYKGGPVAGYISDCIVQFTLRKYPADVRLKALEGLGLVCQAWPGQFNKLYVRETFFEVLNGKNFSGVDDKDILRMQVRVLEAFEELYRKRASMIEEAKKAEDGAEVQALKNIGGDSKTREDDSAIAAITNDLVDHLLKIISAEPGEKALLAAQTLASIDHQGMTHPKQSTSAFVALETSQDAQVADIAKAAHEHLHQQHESVCEREYINAILAAFRYQNEVFHDPRGGVVPGFRAKLAPAFAIISTSGSKYVKKFLSNLISKINTEYSKVNVAEQAIPEHLLLVLFVTQNLAFFDYKKMDELLHTVLQLELAFGKNGAETAQAIEMHIPPAPVVPTENNEAGEPLKLEPATEETSIDPLLLKRLSTAASAITLISEARDFLKRQYAISRDVKMAMQQNKQTKDAGKEPVKVHGITGDKFWQNTNAVLQSLTSTEAMIARCREFVTLVAVDDEVKIAEEEAEMNGMTDVAPELGMSAPRGKKRKSGSGSIGGTPKRPRGRLPKNGFGRRSTSISSLEEDPDGDFNG